MPTLSDQINIPCDRTWVDAKYSPSFSAALHHVTHSTFMGPDAVESGLDATLREHASLLGCALSKFLEKQDILRDTLLRQQQYLMGLLEKNQASSNRSRSESPQSQSEEIVLHETDSVTERATLEVINQPTAQSSPPKMMMRSSGMALAPPVKKHTSEALYERVSALAEDFDTRLGYEAIWEYPSERDNKKSVFQKKSSFCARLCKLCRFNHHIVDRAPKTCAAMFAEHSFFMLLQTLLIMSNTLIMAYEADLQVKASLKNQKGGLPKWLDATSMIFNVAFAMELAFRIYALRLWFWLSPGDWIWNVLDVVLVVSSIVLEVLTGGAGFGFLRTFRVLRLVRVARIFRVLRFFQHLREMLFAILACFASLMWSFVFMAIVMFLFSLLCVQGATEVIDQMHEGNLAGDAQLHGEIEKFFGSLSSTMLSLLCSVTGGIDWLDVYHPLTYSGSLYPAVFLVYMLFITFGVMNVLTGVFLVNAESFVDLDLLVHQQQGKAEKFVEQLVDVFKHMDDGSGLLTFQAFNKALNHKTTQAFLQSLELDTTHAQLIFELLDKDGKGEVEIDRFVLGMHRLRGNAKAIDSRVILRELAIIPKLLRELKSSN